MQKQKMTFEDYEKPPVTEVSLSVQFEPLRKFRTPYVGCLWDAFRTSTIKLQKVREKPPLRQTFELFTDDEKYRPKDVILELSDIPPMHRYWFLNEEETELVQIQNDRFIRNWRRLNPSEDYPRYSVIRERFIDDYRIFESFIKEKNLGKITPNQCEITYVNTITAKDEYAEPGNLKNVITVFKNEYSDQFLPDLENASMTLHYVITGEDSKPLGRLHISLQTVLSERKDLIYLLKLVARGMPIGEGLDGVLKFLDVGHEWIVRGFTSVTTKLMHKEWGRRVE